MLTPGRYVGAGAAEEDDEPFEERMRRLVATLQQQQAGRGDRHEPTGARIWRVNGAKLRWGMCGYDLPQRDRAPGKVLLVSSSGVTDYHSTAMVKGPGVVTGRYGTLGQVFYIDEDYWPLNTTLYVRDFKGNDPRFISYFLRGLDFFAYSDKAAVPGLNRNHLHQDKSAMPLPAETFRNPANVWMTFEDFLRFCNIIQPPHVERGLFT